jgi:hypothetical protein
MPRSRWRWYAIHFASLAVLVLALSAPVPAATPASKAVAPRRNRPTAAVTGPACLGKALGGMENVARMSTLYTRSQIERGGLKGVDVVWRDVRGAARESLDVPGAFTELTVFDGMRGWRRGPNGVVLPLSGVDLEDVVTEAYLGSFMHVVPGRIPGSVVRVGLDRKSGLVKLRVNPKGGTPMILFIDTLTCLPARIEAGAGARTTQTSATGAP